METEEIHDQIFNKSLMNNPYKILYKVKNKLGKYHYFIYVFVGNVPQEIKNILLKIQNLSLSETFKSINKIEFNEMKDFYGINWFYFFFNKYHINKFLNSNRSIIEEFEKKFNIKFDVKKINFIHKFTYGFQVERKNIIHEKLTKKTLKENINDVVKDKIFQSLDNDDINDIMIGGKEEQQETEEPEEIEDDFNAFLNNKPNDLKADESVNFVEEDEQETNENQINQEQQEQQEEQQEDSEAVLNSLNTEIKNNKKLDSLVSKKEIKDNLKYVDFDDSKDSDYYNDELYNCFEKKYVFNQYIKDSDTITELKEKLFFTIKNNKIFGVYNNIEPSRIYLWSEYLYNGKYQPYQIEKEIIKDNKLLNFPIEPVNIYSYYNLTDEIKKVYGDLMILGLNRVIIKDKRDYILLDRKEYIDNNEIFMIDVYNEIGINTALTIQPVQIQNLFKTFITLYFDKISYLEINDILAYIANAESIKSTQYTDEMVNREHELIKNHYTLNYSSYIMKSQIDNIMSSEYNKNGEMVRNIIKSMCMTRVQIKVDLISNLTMSSNNIDIYTIFNELNGNSKYLFIQYTKLNGTTLFKFSESALKNYLNKEFKGASQNNLSQVIKWFDISQPGLTFKYQYDINRRPLHVYIDNFGRLSFDIYENCENNLIYSKLNSYFDVIKNIVYDLNKTGIVFQFRIPDYSDFKIKFINSIKTFKLDGKKINYNDLTDFFRLFYPYFTVVIEPKKRIKENKTTEYNKTGTYLRYKKISNYQTKQKIIKTIKKYRKYYDSSQEEIINEISKEFNLTLKDSEKLFDECLKMYPRVKQIRKLRKITYKTKYKTEGVNVEIQHKEDSYVIKYHGLRDKEQDKEITTYISIILQLYKQIYLSKNQKYFYIKDKLKNIENVAKQKFEIYDIEKKASDLKTTKINQLMDKDRLGFKPSKGKSVWSRLCQNSGKKIRRQPKLYSNIDELVKAGYKFNKSSGYFERQIKNKDKTTVLKAVKLSNSKSEDIYYTCGPDTNGKHMYIGLLNKTSPDGKALPCCFINDKLDLQLEKFKKKKQNQNDIYDINYILQPTRNIPNGRLSILPNILNQYFNVIQNKKQIQIQYILKETNPDFYYGYGVIHNFGFLSSIATALGITIKEMIDRINQNLNEEIFNSLNNGMIKTIYETKENYLKKINNFNTNNSEKKILKDDEIWHLLTIPGIITKEGLNIIVFTKNNNNVLKSTEDNIYIKYVNDEEIDNIDDKQRKNIILYFNQFEYLIISRVYKNKDDIDPIIKKIYDGSDEIIKYIKPFYKSSNNTLDFIYKNLYSKQMINLIKINSLKVEKQVLNSVNKTIFFIVNNNKNSLLIPVIPSGSIFNVPFIYNSDKEYENYVNSYETIEKNLNIYEKIKLKFIGFYYYKIKNNNYYIKELIFSNGENRIGIPIKKYKVSTKEKFLFVYKQYYKKIDDFIKKYPDIDYNPDDRVKYINYEKYKTTAFQYFRYNISYYISKNKEVKDKLIELIKSDNSLKHDELNKTKENIKEIRRLIYELIENQQLHKFYKSMVDDNKPVNAKINDKMTVFIYNKKSLQENKEIKENFDKQKNNIKKICYLSKRCDNIFCSLDKNNKCVFSITLDLLVDFINRICYELLNNGIKCYELLNIKGYYVSNVMNSNIYKIKDGQKILKKTDGSKTNVFINYLKENPYGINDYDPKDEGDKYNMISYKMRRQQAKIDEIVEKNKPKKINNFVYQNVFNQNDTILRAYVNCLNWLVNINSNDKNKNLGYYNTEQDKIINFIKSKVIDHLLTNNNEDYEFLREFIKNTNDIKNFKIILKYLFDIFNYHIVLIDPYNNISDIIGFKDKQELMGKNISYLTTDIKNLNIESLIIIKINNYEIQSIESCYYDKS